MLTTSNLALRAPSPAAWPEPREDASKSPVTSFTTAELHRVLAGLSGRSLLKTTDLSQQEILAVLEAAYQMKQGRLHCGAPMLGKLAALLFFNPSLRTRLSMAAAVTQLGGQPLVVDVGQSLWNLETRPGAVMDQDKVEHLLDAVPVTSLYADMVAVRSFPKLQSLNEDLAEPVLDAFTRLGDKPLINLESCMHHPCQALADMLSVREAFGGFKKRRAVLAWTWHPKALPMAVPNSFALAAAQCGLDLTIACPPTHALPAALQQEIEAQAAQSGATVTVAHDLDQALSGADVVYAKSWSSTQHYGDAEAEKASKAQLRHWLIDEERMARTKDEAIFLHCLPIRRNVEATDAVLDGPKSRILSNAANRLHAQKALIAGLMGAFRE